MPKPAGRLICPPGGTTRVAAVAGVGALVEFGNAAAVVAVARFVVAAGCCVALDVLRVAAVLGWGTDVFVVETLLAGVGATFVPHPVKIQMNKPVAIQNVFIVHSSLDGAKRLLAMENACSVKE